MKSIFLLFGILLLSCSISNAQNRDDYKKFEFYGGYTHTWQAEITQRNIPANIPGAPDISLANPGAVLNANRVVVNGFNLTATRNVNRYFGFKADFSAGFKSKNFPDANNQNLRLKTSIYNLMGGMQIKDNSSEKQIKPFGYALAGVGITALEVTGGGFNPIEAQTGIATAFGGGIDIKLTKRIDLRAIKVDYNPIFHNNFTQHNVRIGAGIVFR